MPSTENIRTVILSSDLIARRLARDCRDRPWLHNAKLTWSPWTDWGPSVQDSKTENLCKPPAPPEYFEIPFRDQYYFCEFLLATIEDCCNDYARNNLWDQLESSDWRRANLTNLPEWLSLRWSWFKPGVTELTEWTLLFSRIKLPGVIERTWSDTCVFINAPQLRHKTIHRERVRIQDILSAMRIPRLLNFEQKADTVHQTYDRWLNKDTRKGAMRFLLTPRKIEKGHQLLSRLQNLMEESFFNYTRRVNPGQLVERGWHVFEQVELQTWQMIYERSWDAPWDAPYREFFSDRNLFSIALHEMREMRNIASHRNLVDKWDAMEYLKRSMMLALLMDDPFQAVAIEVVGEQWLTSSSDRNVLKRLQDVFLEDTDLGINTTEPTPEGALFEEIQDSVPEDVQAEDAEAEGTAETTLAYEAAEMKKRKANRERKRRYAVAKVIVSAELDNARQRARGLPHRSALKSLLFNLPIPNDDEGLVNEDRSVVRQELITKEAQVEADRLSYIDLVGKPKDEDQGWSDQDTATDCWGSCSTDVESSTEAKADAAGKAEAEVEVEREAQAEGQAEGELEAQVGPQKVPQAKEEAEAESHAEPVPKVETEENLAHHVPLPDSPTTDDQQAVSFEDTPLVWPPMFGAYQAVYEQMLSESMHDVYKLTDDEMRERRWHRFSE